jgi:hypothetical protein
MSKRYFFLLFLIFLLFFLVWRTFIWYALKAEKHLDILVMNKTVPDNYRVEHRALFWVLKNHKIIPSWGNRYNHKKDYYGFFPEYFKKNEEKAIRRIGLTELDSLAEKYHLAYFADSYGVQYSDWGIEQPEELPNLIYGGLNQNDFLFMQQMASWRKPVFMEYNLLAPPTSDLIRIKVEDFYGIFWSGWKGKYFGSLKKGNRDSDVPDWIMKEWELQNDLDWQFNQAGIILIRADNTILVLENITHLDIEVPLVLTDHKYSERFQVEEIVSYSGWFEITYTLDVNKVSSFFELNTNSEGSRLMRKYRLPQRFPAVIIHEGDRPFVYLAGNFSRHRISFSTARSPWAGGFRPSLKENEFLKNRDFFLDFYRPFMGSLLEEIIMDKSW